MSSNNWDEICPEALRLLKSENNDLNTVVKVAEHLGVNHRMLSRRSKERGVSLNLKGHGTVKRGNAITQLKQPAVSELRLWKVAFFGKAA